MIRTRWHSRKDKYSRKHSKEKQEQWLEGIKRQRGINRQSTDNFRTMKLFCILHNTIRMNIFVKVHRMYNTKSELKCELWSLSDYNISTQIHRWLKKIVPFWWVILTMGKAINVLGEEVYGKCQYFPLNFALNLKLFKKK